LEVFAAIYFQGWLFGWVGRLLCLPASLPLHSGQAGTPF
jgi:hypothetical protein